MVSTRSELDRRQVGDDTAAGERACLRIARLRRAATGITPVRIRRHFETREDRAAVGEVDGANLGIEERLRTQGLLGDTPGVHGLYDTGNAVAEIVMAIEGHLRA